MFIKNTLQIQRQSLTGNVEDVEIPLIGSLFCHPWLLQQESENLRRANDALVIIVNLGKAAEATWIVVFDRFGIAEWFQDGIRRHDLLLETVSRAVCLQTGLFALRNALFGERGETPQSLFAVFGFSCAGFTRTQDGLALAGVEHHVFVGRNGNLGGKCMQVSKYNKYKDFFKNKNLLDISVSILKKMEPILVDKKGENI